jgi:hypothetical protein
LTGVTAAFQTDSSPGASGKNFIYIGKGPTAYVDVVNVISVTGALYSPTVSGTQTQIANYFTLDNGQRDNYYDWSRLILSSNATPSSTLPTTTGIVGITGTFDITFTRFVHSNASSVTGPFMVNSYTDGGVDYKDIPTYVSPTTGRSYRLSDVLNFRPARQNDGSFRGFVLPMPSPSIANDNKFGYTVYLSKNRQDCLTGRDRTFKVLQGVPSTTRTASSR